MLGASYGYRGSVRLSEQQNQNDDDEQGTDADIHVLLLSIDRRAYWNMLRARQSVRKGTLTATESRYDFPCVNACSGRFQEKIAIPLGTTRSLTQETHMKQSFRTLLKITAASALALASLSASAQSAGSNIVNVGWFHFDTHDSSDPLTVTSPPLGRIPGSGASVGNADTLGIAFTHFYTDNFALTADFGLPPKFDLDSKGLGAIGIADGSHLGSARQWSPALVAKWYFGGAQDKLRPFVGAGVTYVWYSDVKVSPALSAPFGGTSTSADLSSSFAPIANAGLVYNFDKNWSLGLSVSYIWLDTDADITGKNASGAVVARAKTHVTLDPLVTFLSVGYRF
jgi:outer membrane protein